MKTKIIYHIGNSINSQTIMKKGYIYANEEKPRIEYDKGIYNLDDIKSVELYKMNGLGTMVKLLNKEDTIYLSVPRIFLSFFQKPLDKSKKTCYNNTRAKPMGNCVKVARQTLTLFVGVRIPIPQPKNPRSSERGFFYPSRRLGISLNV